MLPRKHILPLLLTFLLCSQQAQSQQQYGYRISFTDKTGAPPLSDPQAFLSQRALDRRTAQSIAVDESDRPVSPDYIDSVLTLTGGTFHSTSRWLNNCVVLLDSHADTLSLANKPYIADITYIASYPNGLHMPAAGGEPGNSTTPTGIAAKTTADPAWYGAAWTQTDLVKGHCLHDLGLKGQGMLIAVMDDGYNNVNTAPGFNSLYQSGRILDTRNFVLAINNVYGYSAHGTQVLSTMAGYIPNTYVGAAPEAQYALYITEDLSGERPIEMDNFLAAAERADSIGADVISSSLGYNWMDNPFPDLSYADINGSTTVAAQAVNMATQKGIVCVISAGNEGGNSWNYILTPGDADSAITVGSALPNKTMAGNSGFGPNSAGHQKPNISAQGAPASVLSSTATPATVNGTSMATPQVGGYAACLLQAHPGSTPYQVRKAIEKSGHLYPNPTNHAGYGVPDLCAALSFLDVPATPQPLNQFAVVPNPFRSNVSLILTSHTTEAGMVVIADVTGKTVWQQPVQVNAGDNLIALQLPAYLSGGFYLGKMILGDQSHPFKLVKE